MLDVREVTRLVRASGALCALTRGGRLRCAHYWSTGWSERRVVGLPERTDAVDGAEDDLSARGVDGRWRCTAGPTSRTPPDPSRSEITLHPEPALDGATSVAFHHDGGCARWADGRLRCWGHALRASHVLRRGATVMHGLDAVTALAGGYQRMCAIQRGGLWCWGGAPLEWTSNERSLPTRVPLPGVARAIAPGVVAVGADVWSWGRSRPELLPRPAGATGEVVALAATVSNVCARRADGHVHCWHSPSPRDTERPPSRYVAERVSGLEGFARLGARGDEVCAWTTGRGGRCWSRGVEARSTVREVDVRGGGGPRARRGALRGVQRRLASMRRRRERPRSSRGSPARSPRAGA
ncbi:MAG: hypothetical protein R3A52_22930 [Polyangiales bacterium]